jgi:hypothetical protein
MPKSKLTEEIRAALGTAPDRALAARYGVALQTVKQWRWKLGVPPHRVPQDLRGRTYGRLRVLAEAPRFRRKRPSRRAWVCKCDPERGGCGRVLDVDAADLHNVQSCGCLREEMYKNGNWRHFRQKFPEEV